MSASVEYFLPLIQCAALVVVHNVVFFDETKSTFLCDWVEGACLLNKVPFNLKGGVRIFQVPGMETKLFMCLLPIFLMLLLCWFHLSLKVLPVRPVYVSLLPVAVSLTVAL